MGRESSVREVSNPLIALVAFGARRPYAFTLLALLGATLARLALAPALGTRLPYVTFLVAAAVTAWCAGLTPALLVGLCGAGIAYFAFASPPQILPPGLFVDLAATGLLIAVVLRLRRDAERSRAAAAEAKRQTGLCAASEERLRVLNEELEERVAERTRALTEANFRLRELDRLKREFLAVMSHELRTPLNAIIGFGEIVAAGDAGTVTEQQRQYLDYVLTAGHRLHDMINDLLTVSRLEAGQEPVVSERLRLDHLLAEQVDIVRPQLDDRRLTMETDLSDAPEIVSDGRKVKTIVSNMLDNAVKFSHAGAIRIAADVDEREVRVRVRDSCHGITPEEATRVFDPFVQLDSSLGRAHEGTGMGLYLSRKLARLLGGDMRVDTSPLTGCEFVLHLPRQSAA